MAVIRYNENIMQHDRSRDDIVFIIIIIIEDGKRLEDMKLNRITYKN